MTATFKYEVTVSGRNKAGRSIAEAFAKEHLPDAVKRQGQLGPYWRVVFLEKPSLPMPPAGVEVKCWASNGIVGSGHLVAVYQ